VCRLLSLIGNTQGSADALNYRHNFSPDPMMRTYTPEPRGFRGGRRELPREPWRQGHTDPPTRARRDNLSFEQAVAFGITPNY